jgi:hypothetical protein
LKAPTLRIALSAMRALLSKDLLPFCEEDRAVWKMNVNKQLDLEGDKNRNNKKYQ